MKKFLAITILCLMSITAKADYTLYWMASPWSASYWGAEYAAIKGGNGTTYTELDYAYLDDKVETNISDITQYVDFIVSLYKLDGDNWVELAVSWDKYTYQDLVKAGYAYENKGDETQIAKDPLVFRSFVIPEPTSGLMLLLGLGSLALKRKIA